MDEPARGGRHAGDGRRPERAPVGSVGPLITGRRRLAGSSIGSRAEARELLDLCAERDIAAEVEVIDAGRMNEAFARLDAADVRYRLVLDATTL